MSRKMRILHVLSSHIYSGAENVVCQIISLFQDDPDYEMVYCSPDGPIREALAARNIPFEPLEQMNGKEVRRVIQKLQPDLIHSHDVKAGILCARSAGKQIPVFSHIHSCFDSGSYVSSMTRPSLKALAYLSVTGRFQKIFWVSNSALDGYFFSRSVRKKSQVLYNVVDDKKIFAGVEADSNTYSYDVIFLGRFTWAKNMERIVKIIRELLEQPGMEQLRAVFVGTGELYDSICELIQKEGLENVITLAGYQSNPYKILASSKVFLMASRYEGTPMSVLEAMALGVPVVSTPLAGIADVVVSGETGYLEETDKALVSGIRHLLLNPAERNEMAEKSRQRFAQICDLRQYRQTLDQAYRENIR